MTIRITASSLRNPSDSQRTIIGEEDACHCDGIVCGMAGSDEEGQLVEPGPHDHLIVRGEEPDAAARYFFV